MTLVFFFPKPIRKIRRELFQLDRLEKEGFKIIVIDATEYFDNNNKFFQPVIFHNTIRCSTFQDFIEFRNEELSTPVLFITSDLYINKFSKIFKTLLRKEDRLLAYNTKSFSDANFTSKGFKLFTEKFIKKLDKIFPIHFFKFYYSWRYGLVVPDYYLFSTNYIIPLKIFLTVKKENRIVVHSDDYNFVLNDKPALIDKNKKIGVFIDQAIPFAVQTHPELYKNKDLPVNYLEGYYRNVETALNKLRQSLELDEIVIALHPNSKNFKNELEGKFSGFRSFSGNTQELIRDSHIIFTHNSTALGYAVIYEKPVVILKDALIMGEKIGKATKFFLNDLDMTGIYLDREWKKLSNQDVKLNRNKYAEYRKNFIKDNSIQENSYYHAIKMIEEKLNEENSVV